MHGKEKGSVFESCMCVGGKNLRPTGRKVLFPGEEAI